MDKRGIIGGMMVTFVATILIIVILIIFVIGATFIREFDGAADELRVYDEVDVGIGDIGSYMLNYSKLTNVRYRVEVGGRVAEVLKEVGYDK